MRHEDVIKELGRIKHNCNCITFSECQYGMCPYSKRTEKGTIKCLYEELGMNMPCDWEIPEEIVT